MKRVHYNGNTESYIPCQPASDLSGTNSRWGIGYEVEEEVDYGYQTNYVLKGIEQKDFFAKPGYNSVWFKTVPVYLAQASMPPVVGETLTDFIRFDEKGNPEKMSNSSKILKVTSLSNEVYEVYTANSTYIVQIVK